MTKKITQEEYDNVMSLIQATNKAWRNMNEMQQIILDMVEPHSEESEEDLIDTIMDACCNCRTFEEAEERFTKWSGITKPK